MIDEITQAIRDGCFEAYKLGYEAALKVAAIAFQMECIGLLDLIAKLVITGFGMGLFIQYEYQKRK